MRPRTPSPHPHWTHLPSSPAPQSAASGDQNDAYLPKGKLGGVSAKGGAPLADPHKRLERLGHPRVPNLQIRKEEFNWSDLPLTDVEKEYTAVLRTWV